MTQEQFIKEADKTHRMLNSFILNEPFIETTDDLIDETLDFVECDFC